MKRLAGTAAVLIITAIAFAVLWAVEDEALPACAVIAVAFIAAILAIGYVGWVAGGVQSVSIARRVALGCLGPVTCGTVVLLWSAASVDTEFPYSDATDNVLALVVAFGAGFMYYLPYWIGLAAALVVAARRAKNRTASAAE